jgi:hypothetical protein
MKQLTPVIHVKSESQALRNAEICAKAGTKGFFLINHQIRCAQLLKIAEAVRGRFPAAWIGLNVLDEDPLEVIPDMPPVDGFWADDPKLVEGQEKQEAAQAVWQALRQRQNPILYFGSIAFKGQPQPADLRTLTRLACLYMDVVTTSGEATGMAAEPAKLQAMHEEAGETPLGIASGITPDNVRAYTPYVTWFLVASGISVDFHNLSPELVRSLNDLIIATGAQQFKPV